MSPARVAPEPAPKAMALARSLAVDLGREITQERVRRGWLLADLAGRAGMSIPAIHRIELGEPSSVDGYARLAAALDLKPRFTLLPERAARAVADVDPVHAALGEVEAEHFQAAGFDVLLDEPYQHYQFAGRADVVAIDRARRAMLHIENRTRFPDIQAFVGAYKGKQAYLAPELARRLGIRGRFVSETHVVVALWSSEVLHSIRLREASFRSVCPDPTDAWAGWWAGEPPALSQASSSLVLFDPLEGQRSTRRRWVGLDALRTVAPRYRGYAHALQVLRDRGRA